MSECDYNGCRMGAETLTELFGEEGFEVASLCQSHHGWASVSRKLVVIDVGQ